MIEPINGVNSGYLNNIKPQAGRQTLPVEKKPPVFYADPTAAIKSGLSVKAPMPYSFVRDINVPYSNPAKYYRLANGQKVIILQKPGQTVVKSYFNVGSLNEKEEEKGIFHFIEHMKFNGSENLAAGEFFDTVNKMGASTNASTGMSTTDYYVATQILNENDLDTTIKIHADMLQTPSHTPEMVEKEKGPVLSEISMCSDEPVNLALNTCIKNLFGIKTNVPDLVAGTISTVGSLTSEQVKANDDAWYSPDNCVTVITGNINPQKTIELVSKYFTSQRQSKTENRVYTELTPIDSPVRADALLPKAKNSTIILGFKGPNNNSAKEMIVQDLLAGILFGSRDGRISGMLDKIHSSGFFASEKVSNKPDAPSAIMLISQTSPQKAEEVLKMYYRAIQEVKANPITQKELDKEKLGYKMALSEISENSGSLNSFIGSAMLNGNTDFIENNLQILDNITTKDLDDFAKKYLDLNKVSLSLVHPADINEQTLLDNYKKSSTISFKGAIPEVFDETKIKQYNLKNNMTAVFNPNSSEIVNYKLNLNAKIPAMVKPGTPQILSRMLMEGSMFKNRSQFFNQAEQEGIYLSLASDSKEIDVSCTAPSNSAQKSLKYMKEALLNPRFTQERLDYTKAKLTEALKNTEVTASDMLYRELFPDISEYATADEIEKSISSITLADIIGLYQYIMQNAQADFVMTAPVENNPMLIPGAINELSFGFPNFKPKTFDTFKRYTPIKENKLITKEDKRIQAEIKQAYTFKINNNPKDRLTFILLDTILGGNPSSRLFSDLREKQMLAYRVNSDFDAIGDTGIISLYIKTTTDDKENNIQKYDNVQKSLDGFKKHIEKLKTEMVPEEELNAAKLRLKTTFLNETESSADRTDTLMSNLYSPYSVKSTDKYLKLIDEITPEDIYNAANYAFSGNSVTSVVASENTLKNMPTTSE